MWRTAVTELMSVWTIAGTFAVAVVPGARCSSPCTLNHAMEPLP